MNNFAPIVIFFLRKAENVTRGRYKLLPPEARLARGGGSEMRKSDFLISLALRRL